MVASFLIIDVSDIVFLLMCAACCQLCTHFAFLQVVLLFVIAMCYCTYNFQCPAWKNLSRRWPYQVRPSIRCMELRHNNGKWVQEEVELIPYLFPFWCCSFSTASLRSSLLHSFQCVTSAQKWEMLCWLVFVAMKISWIQNGRYSLNRQNPDNLPTVLWNRDFSICRLSSMLDS